MNRATGDWNKTRFIHGFTMVLTFDLLFFASLALVSMFLIDIPTTIVCLLTVPIVPFFLVKLSKQEYLQHQKAQETLSRLSDLISQTLSTVRLQRATNTSTTWEKRLDAEASDYAEKRLEVLKTTWKIFLTGAAPTIFAYAVLFTFGMMRFHQNAITLGEFLALQSYIVLLQSPLFEIGSAISEWQTGFASFQRVNEILNKKAEDNPPRDKISLFNVSNNSIAIRLHDITLSYESHHVLKHISLSVKHGEKIGITGPIGTGKTTILQIISGLAPPYEGRAELFGNDIPLLPSQVKTDLVSLVPQTPFLFAGTIRYNLELNKSFDDESLQRALRAVRLWDDIDRLDGKLDAYIGEWGINLSGGQKQRLTLARALLHDSEVLLIDDALSAVDAVTEEYILDQISEFFGQRTVIWTAHRRSTLALCDKVFRLEDGQLTPLATN